MHNIKRGARVGVMELPEMGTWKNGNEDGRSHFRFVLKVIREVSGSIIFPFQYSSQKPLQIFYNHFSDC